MNVPASLARRVGAGAAPLLALLALTGCGSAGEARPEPPGRARARAAPLAPLPARPFAPDSVWNAPVPDGAPVDARSPQYVAELGRQLRVAGPYINTTQYSSPVYTVRRGQPRVRVTLDEPNPGLQRALDAVPIPAGAEPAEGTDAHLTVWQPSSDTIWELWVARHSSDGWHARYGGRIAHASRNPGYFTSPPEWGATGTSLPLLGGLMRTAELQRGELPHALALAIPQTRAGSFVSPAQRSDGNLDSPAAIPEGTRFRLDPRLDLEKLRLPPLSLAIARAAQRYGMIVRDQSGCVCLYAEDPGSGPDPYEQIFAHTNPRALLAALPWQRLQAMAPPRP